MNPARGGNRMMYRCPHCQTRAQIRTSRAVTPLLRELIWACNDAECGHTFVVHAGVVRTLSPSAKPDPAIHIPLSTAARTAIEEHSSWSDGETAAGVRVAAPVPAAGGGMHAIAR